jgi:hypothetical protein
VPARKTTDSQKAQSRRFIEAAREAEASEDEAVFDETLKRLDAGWKKIVQVTAISACPKCGNRGFDLEPGGDIDDPRAMVKCGKCGHVCPADEFSRAVDPQYKTT